MNERQLVNYMLGNKAPSVLMSDGYKFAMAQAGFPLRQETFYLSFRKPGWYFIPFDLEAVVSMLSPSTITFSESEFLNKHGYHVNAAMQAALESPVLIHAAPKGSWVREREPILTVTAPSFLASWLEPLAIWLQYPIQVATQAVLEGRCRFVCCCDDEAAITKLAVQAAGLPSPEIEVDAAGYQEQVRQNAADLINSLDGESHRLFEVGMRGATCMKMHELSLRACRDMGLTQTSNVFLAKELGLKPVGTTGHEHQQRWGNDLDAFRAIRDMRPQPPSFLFDTYDALKIGLPAAVGVIRESADRACSVRFDSGDQEYQLRQFLAAGVEPTFVFMDSLDATKARQLENVASHYGVPANQRLYGSGGFLVGKPAATDLTRDRVAAVYKLSQTGNRPVMKFSVPSKSTIPGVPVIFRRVKHAGPVGLIGQQGETPPAGYRLLESAGSQGLPHSIDDDFAKVGLSIVTERLVAELRQQKVDWAINDSDSRSPIQKSNELVESERCYA